MRAQNKTVDFIIIGGGLVGMITAILLRHSNFSVRLVEQRQPTFQRYDTCLDNRSIVLNQGSKRILDTVGLWQNMAADAQGIKQVHVSQEGCFAKTRFNAHQEDVEALGYVVPAVDIAQQYWEALSHYGVEIYCPMTVERLDIVDGKTVIYIEGMPEPLQSQCALIADGAHSPLRRQLGFTVTSKDYQQKAWVTQVRCQLPHKGVAYERFLTTGILALVPLKDPYHMGVIWSTTPEEAMALSLEKPTEFLHQLQQRMGYSLGTFLQCGAIQSFPLQQVIADSYAQEGCLLLGNAAHFLNPLAAQGLNLSIRDASVLRDIMLTARKNHQSLGSMDVLNTYVAERRREHERLAQFTHGVNQIFHGVGGPMAWLRGLGLYGLERITPLKRHFAQRTMGLYGKQSRLMRGLL
ncbi:MAG: FAD-dependent monooxygenase [Gammaproteobacteria bacterium]